MSTPDPSSQPLEELRHALAEADSQAPPTLLRARVLAAAEAARPPGVATGTGPPITAAEAYRRTTDSFDNLLTSLREDEWHRPALRDLDIQCLIGHLIGVERQLHAAVGIAAAVTTGRDHVASTQEDALSQVGRAPAETLDQWRELIRRTLEYATALDRDANQRVVSLHGFTMSLERMLVLRAFETWTHEEDIRRATGRPLAAPDPARLRLMTDVAVSALPMGLDNIGRPKPGRTARIVLTGPGGGTWQAALDRGTPGSTDVRVIADAVSFCRLVANRLTPSELAPVITGDDALAADVLTGAQALALD
jgi:uncharacterized protein (TIGR03083 family)